MSHQINIDKNGTTTLATAGKYCDRNIDVNVNVPTTGTELVNSIIGRTITGHYENNEVTKVGASALSYCYELESVTFGVAVYITGYVFDQCTSLKRVDLPNVKTFYNNVFKGCTSLEKVILRREDIVVSLGNVNSFSNSGVAAGTGYIYVPDNLVDSYKTATNWATYASQIKPLSELEE